MPSQEAVRLHRRRFLYGAGVGAAVGIGGCVDGDGSTPGDDGEDTDDGDGQPVERTIQSEFITATESEATDLHLYHITDIHSDFRVNSILDGAYTLDMNDEFYSLWIEEIDNVDNEEYVYTLRDNLQWGGEYGQMTADDWVFHWDAVISDAVDGDNWTAHPAASDWAQVETVEAEDDDTFTITLQQPNPLWVQTPAMWGEYLYPADLVRPYYESWQDGEEDAGENLAQDEQVLNFEYAGNLGPYSFDRRDPEDRWVATRNDEYYRRGQEPDADLWEDAPYFEQYTIRVLDEQSTRLAELETENLTGLGTASPIPPDQVPNAEEWDHIDLYRVPSPFVFITTYNQRANGWEPFRNREVRRAFSMAIDKEVITDSIYHEAAEPGQTFQPQWSEFFEDDEVEAFGVGDSYDPDGARQILEAELPDEGYTYDGDTLVDGEGLPVELTFVHRERHAAEADAGAYHADQYEDVLGIDIDRQTVPSTTFFDEYVDQEDDEGNLLPNAGPRDEYTSRRAWDILWSLGLNTYPRSPDQVSIFWGENAPFNFMGWQPPEDVDIAGMVEEAGGDFDQTQDVLAEVFGILSREQPANFVLFTDDVAGYHESLQVSEEDTEFGWGYLGSTWWATEDIFA